MVRTIAPRASSGADAIRVTIGVPGLSVVKDSGNIKGTDVTIKISVQHNGGGYVDKVTDTISHAARPFSPIALVAVASFILVSNKIGSALRIGF